MGGFARCGDPKVGTCTIAKPASNIDYFVMSNSVRDIVAAAVIDEGSTTKPHRGVTTEMQTGVAEKVPKQTIEKLKAEIIIWTSKET